MLFKCKNGFKRTAGSFCFVKNNRSAILLVSLFKRKQKEPIYKNVVCLRHRNALIGRASYIVSPVTCVAIACSKYSKREKFLQKFSNETECRCI